MEILILVLLYYLSQNPNFSKSVQPLMAQIKDSEQMLRFLKDLSSFAETFHFKGGVKATEYTEEPPKKEEQAEKKQPQSPTEGIADTFIQNILDSYFKQNKT